MFVYFAVFRPPDIMNMNVNVMSIWRCNWSVLAIATGWYTLLYCSNFNNSEMFIFSFHIRMRQRKAIYNVLKLLAKSKY